MYSTDGKPLSESIWKETLDDLEFAKARETVRSMSSA